MSTTTTQRVELPAGYTVMDRLGAGGYGEVWKATAPGGLEKAVKIVFGHCDEGMAERELKSLERIKSVRHPFLLSIERYEIVNNRLVIVTELADMSLSDCFQNHVATGRSGIPRDQLIGYLWDAAEALDCLLELHSLQHLDIKPENLLVVGDHIKVADFGLVKELAAKTLHSVMGGMTPLYSAPEIYDNNPSPRSDQYSLAIVYQHMLTATLPFSGRTPAQLAKQHTLAQPNVNPLSEADRQVVRRALEKDPQARFASCREFVTALRSAGQGGSLNLHVPPTAANSSQPTPISSDDTRSISLIDTKHLRDPICIAATQKLAEVENAIDEMASLDISKPARASRGIEFPAVDSQIVDVETPTFDGMAGATAVPTLFVGIGGVGIKLLKAIRAAVPAHDYEQQLPLAWLAIDTERETLKTSYDDQGQSCLPNEDKLHIPLRRPNQYRDDSQALLQWVSRRWLYNIPRSLQTRGFRPLGRIAIVDHAAEVLTALQKRIHWLAAHQPESANGPPATRVVILAGMSGGTGSGTVIDLAQAARALCRDYSQDVNVQAVLGCTYHAESNDSLAAANMFALLTELTHAQNNGNAGESSPPGPAALYDSPHCPFDEIYTVQMSGREGRADSELAVQSVANYSLLRASGKIHPAIAAIHPVSPDAVGCHLMRTFSCADLGHLASTRTARYQHGLLAAMVASWTHPGPAINDADARFFQAYSNTEFARAVLARIPEIALAADPAHEAEVTEQRARRSAAIKCLARVFLQFLDTIELQSGREQEFTENPAAVAAGERVITDLCQSLANGSSEKDLERLLIESINRQLDELTASSAAHDQAELAEAAFALGAAGPLDCGYRRHTLLVLPNAQVDSSLPKAFDDWRATLAQLASNVNQTYLVQEGTGLKPLHLGARLAEQYPDIAEAAGRLHARDDVAWTDLRDTIAAAETS